MDVGALVRDTDGRLARPEVQRLLWKMRARGVTSFDRLSVEAARAMVEAAVALEASPAEIHSAVDADVPGPAGPVPVRIYHPHAKQDRRLVIFVHGGGWVTGSIATADRTCRNLAAATGDIVVSVEYRRSPEARFPAPLDDVVQAVQELWERRRRLGADVDRLVLVGESAGGNLVAAAALELRAIVSDQVLIYPALDPSCSSASHQENAEDPVLSHSGMLWFWRQYLGDAEAQDDPRVSPLVARSLVGAPRSFVVTCGLDVLHDEGVEYGARLAAAGVPVTTTDIDGLTHGFLTMSRALPVAAGLIESVAEWLDERDIPRADN